MMTKNERFEKDMNIVNEVFPPKEVTIYEAAEILGCHWQTIRNYTKQGILHSTKKLGKCYVYEKEVLALKVNN